MPGVLIDENPPCFTIESTTGRKDFVSRRNAKPMAASDIANVAKLTRDDAKQLVKAISVVAPGVVAKALSDMEES